MILSSGPPRPWLAVYVPCFNPLSTSCIGFPIHFSTSFSLKGLHILCHLGSNYYLVYHFRFFYLPSAFAWMFLNRLDQCCTTFLTPRAAREINYEAADRTSKLKSNDYHLLNIINCTCGLRSIHFITLKKLKVIGTTLLLILSNIKSSFVFNFIFFKQIA